MEWKKIIGGGIGDEGRYLRKKWQIGGGFWGKELEVKVFGGKERG